MHFTPLLPRRRRLPSATPSSAMSAARPAAGDLAAIADRIAGLIEGPVTEGLAVIFTELYGDALARIVSALERTPNGARALDDLCDDRLVGGLLAIHELHPHSLHARVERTIVHATDAGGPQSCRLDRIEDGVAYIRFEGSADLSTQAVITRALAEMAPEVTCVYAGVEDDCRLQLS